jgi:hypothetical protein
MKRIILISLAAGVAIVPALIGVAAATPSAPSGPSDSRSATPTLSSTVDDRGGHGADDPATATATGSPTSSASSADDRGRSSDDATASAASSAEDRQSRGSDDATASAGSSAEDRQGRDSDDATTSTPTTAVTSSSSQATSSATVEDKGHDTEAGDHSGGHGGKN